MIIPLCKASWKANWKVLLIFALIMSFYFSMILVMYDPAMIDSMAAMLELLPKELIDMLNFNLVVPTYTGFLTSYFYGFLAIGFPSILCIMISYRVMGKMVDRGSISYLLSTPHSRTKIALTQAIHIIMIMSALFLVVVIVGGTLSYVVFPGLLDASLFLLVNFGVWLYFFAVSGICFLVSCSFNESKHSLMLASVFPIGFMIIQMLSQVGDSLSFLKYFTLLTLYQPNDMIQAGYQGFGLIILAVIGLVSYSLAITIFKKRDLPI